MDVEGGGDGGGAARARSWRSAVSSQAVASTVLLELVGGGAGLIALAGWPFGWLPDPGLLVLTLSIPAWEPSAELYRDARPPRGRALAAAFLTLATVSLLAAAAVNGALPATADPDIGLLAGYALAIPVAATVPVRFLGTPEAG
ncbi:putative membrane protein [Streptomyces scabiei 87.22]|uniref:Putative membrane protein n=8 Tax=Streptomyces scabiei TaxID=1930 RepID=C9ZHC9_STRSW|nr:MULTISPECIES: hypothetical protein [Streptomyces]MDX2578000.1 hypothetical protein [Streptomyces scabiei]MDX2656450.1 hypothetical protein [Streptomyces scabiei]MDX2752734.1 hypothetical protein [Streptomyces scabiei]MDX2807067.1 hypothetical protein [Streptomyces scabiei]MDX2833185.1 hypothetical protein [Streptomyces scabiei]